VVVPLIINKQTNKQATLLIFTLLVTKKSRQSSSNINTPTKKKETMSAFTSGDNLNAIVGDIGQYATKLGYAGEDYPRSYFRSVRLSVSFFVVLANENNMTNILL